MGLLRKCLCHDEYNKKRFCYSRFHHKTLLYKQLYEISKILRRLNSGLDMWCLRDAIISALGAMHDAPHVDRLLGQFYLKTNSASEFDSISLILESENILQKELIEFVRDSKVELEKILQAAIHVWRAKFSPGVLAASRFLDEISNSFNGIEENIPTIFLRISVTLASQIKKIEYLQKSFVSHKCPLVEEILILLYKRVCMLPFPCMSNLGLVSEKKSVFDTVFHNVSNFSLEDFLDINSGFFLPAMLNGSYVSVNLTRYHYEAESLMELLLSQLQIVEKHTNKSTGLTIYLEIWHLSLLMWLDFCEILPTTVQVKFCLILPEIFMERLKTENSYWSVFHKALAINLGLYDESDFTSKYLECERTAEHARIKTETLLDNICRCLRRGQMGFIFRKNIHKYSMLPQIASYCLGNSMDVIPFEYGLNTAFRIALNLSYFVENVSEEQKSHTNIDMFHYRDKIFNLKKMRKTVTELVLIGNAVIDYALENRDFLMDGIVNARSLAICVTGLHSALMSMNLPFNSQLGCQLYRIVCENIYYSSVRTSMNCCKKGAEPCSFFQRSKYAQGILHCDLYDNVEYTLPNVLWTNLRSDIKKYGLRNLTFVSGSAMSKEFDLLNCSQSFCPIEGNKILKRSSIKVLHPNPVFHSDLSVYSTELQTLYIPVYNGLFLNRFKNHLEYLSSVNYDVSKVNKNLFSEEEMQEMTIFLNAFDYSVNEMLNMYVGALPFTDHGQANVFFINKTENMRDILVCLYQNGFKTGIYQAVYKNQKCDGVNPSKKFDLLSGFSDGVVMSTMHVFQ